MKNITSSPGTSHRSLCRTLKWYPVLWRRKIVYTTGKLRAIDLQNESYHQLGQTSQCLDVTSMVSLTLPRGTCLGHTVLDHTSSHVIWGAALTPLMCQCSHNTGSIAVTRLVHLWCLHAVLCGHNHTPLPSLIPHSADSCWPHPASSHLHTWRISFHFLSEPKQAVGTAGGSWV